MSNYDKNLAIRFFIGQKVIELSKVFLIIAGMIFIPIITAISLPQSWGILMNYGNPTHFDYWFSGFFQILIGGAFLFMIGFIFMLMKEWIESNWELAKERAISGETTKERKERIKKEEEEINDIIEIDFDEIFEKDKPKKKKK